MMFDRRRPLVFMHIPKTSGMALTAALIRALSPQRPLGGFDRVLFGAFGDFDSFASEVRQTIHDDPSSLTADADLVHGHFAVSTTATRFPDAQFVTVLREPRVRLLSLWRYWQAQTAQTMTGWGSWTDVVARSRAPLSEFLHDPVVACQTDNMTVRMLLWPHELIPDHGFIQPADDAALLDQASETLGRFAHRSFVEDDAMAADLTRWFGLPIERRRVNETRPGLAHRQVAPLHQQLTDRCLDLLKARTRLEHFVVTWTRIRRWRGSCGIRRG